MASVSIYQGIIFTHSFCAGYTNISSSDFCCSPLPGENVKW